jgi:dihydrofolate reductase
MIISLIAAVAENGTIGREGDIPWHLPEDFKLFKRMTMGHHLIMGRKTYESIGEPLPGRTSIVLTRQPGYKAEGCQVAASLPEALEIAHKAGDDEVFIIGGAGVYAQALPLADRFYLSRVHANITGDTVFPEFNEGSWKTTLEAEYPKKKSQRYDFTFKILDR